MNAGLTITQSTLNEEALSITGNGTGQGILVTGGTTGDGVQIVAGTNGIGLLVQGNGSGDGVHIEAGATGEGMHILGGVTSGSALKIEAQGTNDHAMELVSIGTGDGIYVDSVTVTGAMTVATNAIPWNAAWDAEVQSEVLDAINGSQMTESYAVDGVAPTLAQAVFLIQQAITEFTIVVNTGAGTSTTTIKKIDGSTPAATLTLNSETAPTAATRAT